VRVRVYFFAFYRDLAGRDELELELDAGATARDAVAALRKDGGGAERIPADPVIAVNEVAAQLDTPLAEGDEIALLPPVAGGTSR